MIPLITVITNPEGTNVVAMFNAAIEAAIEHKKAGARNFVDSVYDTLAYFNEKEKEEANSADTNTEE